MGSRAFLTYEPLGGSSKRYRVRLTGETISYRQFRKRMLGMSPEQQKVSARKRRRLAPLPIPVTIVDVYGKQGNVHGVLWQGTVIGEYHNTVYGARHWACGVCGLALREERSIIQHLYDHHRVVVAVTPVLPSAATPAYGGRVLYTGDVRSNARRSRMPWRVALPK